MLTTARSLLQYRGLLLTLTGRELKARYRGSALGYLWSLANPLLLLVVYTFVFSVVFTGRDPEADPYGLFLVTGLFPWIWVQTSLMEGTGALLANAGLIRKATFPTELLPAVPVLANLVHFLFAIPVIALAFVVYRLLGYPVGGWSALLLPAVVVLQLPMVLGLALGLGALNAHFKDVRDLLSNLLTMLFFLAPILYTMAMLDDHPAVAWVVRLNPVTPFILAYQQVLFRGQVPSPGLWLTMLLLSLAGWYLGTALFSRLRETLVEAV